MKKSTFTLNGNLKYSESTLKIAKMWGCFENPFANDNSLDPTPLPSVHMRRRCSALSVTVGSHTFSLSGGGGRSYLPYILLNDFQTMFSQLAKRSARVLPADLCTDHAHYVKTIDQRS